MAVMYNDANEVLENGFFQGYDNVVILIVLIQVNKFNSLQDIEGHIEFEKIMKYYVNPLQCDYHLNLGIRWVNCSGCREVCRQYIESICHVHIYHSVFRVLLSHVK